MGDTHQDSTKQQLRAALYARLSETYDAAESLPRQLANADSHAQRRGWLVGRFNDDGYSAFTNQVTINPHHGQWGAPMRAPELMLRAGRERTEFDWRL